MPRKHCPETALTRARLYQPGTPGVVGSVGPQSGFILERTIICIEYGYFFDSYRINNIINRCKYDKLCHTYRIRNAMTTSLELAQHLEAARLASGLTRQALTEQAGVSRQAVYRLFKGNDVQLSTLLAVMEVLQLDLVTLPRTLKRGMPEFGAAPSAPHAPSAVQRRLAALKQGATTPKGRP